MRLAKGRASGEATVRQGEQLGQTEAERPEKYLLWVLSETAAEAGPAPAIAEELSRRLEEPVHALVTPLEEKPLAPAVERAVIHQFAPADSDGTVQRFLDHWHPDFGVVLGYPNRPHLLTAAAEAGVPLLHANATRDAERAARRPPGYLEKFHTCLAASASDASALTAALKGSDTSVEITGPLSDTAHALPCNEAECDDLAALLGGRPVWLAAEAGGDEIAIVGDAHRKAFRSAHRLLLILMPNADEDAEKIAADLEKDGWRVALRSRQEEPDPDVQVYIADTEDELGLWYRLSPVSFLGGTIRAGGVPTDPFAPAALGSAVLHGPNTGPNPSRFGRLDAQGASMLVKNAEELGEAVIALLAPDKAASMAQAGWATTTESAHVVERLAEVMEAIIDEKEGLL